MASINALRHASSLVAAGPGGRCSVSGAVATVFGSTGFLGRYVLNRLSGTGTQTVVPYRCDEHDWRHLRVTGDLGQVHFMYFQLLDKDSVRKAVQNSDIVINLIGQDCDSRHFALDDVHVTGARNIAEACAEAGVNRLVHLSALGADVNSESNYLKSKAIGEQVVQEAFPDATIIRPANIFGYEDRFLNRFAEWRSLPIVGQALFDGGKATKQPVYSLDVAEGIVSSLAHEAAIGNTYEFFGPKEYTVKDIVQFVNTTTRRPDATTYVPTKLARLALGLADRFPVDPIISEEDAIRLSTSDVMTKSAGTLKDFDITPMPMEKVALNWLRRFRDPSQHDSLPEIAN
eukprot:TRINITY_DN6833_c0_g2_i1.p1 TRINITY_DN6833_c0_g2~~TRINITY_DN6833_c0_g2_i1.p1  ORF type:complete len:354 (+),score=81.23 TRINITY_DN6833_c0_g2_i1:28-1062(+)